MFTGKDIEYLLQCCPEKMATADSWGTTEVQIVGEPPTVYVEMESPIPDHIKLPSRLLASLIQVRGDKYSTLKAMMVASQTPTVYRVPMKPTPILTSENGVSVIHQVNVVTVSIAGKAIILDNKLVKLLLEGSNYPNQGDMFVQMIWDDITYNYRPICFIVMPQERNPDGSIGRQLRDYGYIVGFNNKIKEATVENIMCQNDKHIDIFW